MPRDVSSGVGPSTDRLLEKSRVLYKNKCEYSHGGAPRWQRYRPSTPLASRRLHCICNNNTVQSPVNLSNTQSFMPNQKRLSSCEDGSRPDTETCQRLIKYKAPISRGRIKNLYSLNANRWWGGDDGREI